MASSYKINLNIIFKIITLKFFYILWIQAAENIIFYTIITVT
jgi:hypothetical protein